MTKLLLLFSLWLLSGCGAPSTNLHDSTDTTDPQQNEAQAPSQNQPVTTRTIIAGDNQQVLEGKPVFLSASTLDKTKTFTSFVWKEGDTILSREKECQLDLEAGVHQITLVATDTNGETFSDTVTVTIKAPSTENRLPTAKNLHFVTPEDTPFRGSLIGSDADGDPLKYLMVSLPSHGTLSGSAAHLTYRPDPDFYGEDSFYFKTNDGEIDSDPANVTITVEARNDIPVAKSMQVGTDENRALSITLFGTDKETQTLNYTIVDAPQHGSLTGTVPALQYTPQPGFSGSDSFTYLVNDGVADSQPATVVIQVQHVNSAPVLSDTAVQTPEDTPLVVTLSGVDADGDALTYRVTSAPVLGTAQISGNQLTYTPNADVSGVEHLSIVASDGRSESAPAAFTITITAQNDAPVADALSLTVTEDQPDTVTLHASDKENDPLTYRIVTQPTHGRLSQNAADITYTPDPDYYGNDSFTYVANDNAADSQIATVDITVSPVNDAPTAHAASLATSEDTDLAISLTGSDPEHSPLSYTITSSPLHGTLSGTSPNLTYTPDSNYNGTDSFDFKVNDGELDSQNATIHISIGTTNDAPTADPKNLTVDEDTDLTLTLSGSDPDTGDTLIYSIVTNPAHGTLSGTAPNLTYTPNNNFNGTDSFTYKVNDGTVDSPVATVSITVNPVNDAPVANAQTLSTPEDTNKSIMLTGSDPENSTLVYTVVTPPSHGTLVGTAPNITYTPDSNYNGSDSFDFKVSDGTADSPTASVQINITAANDIPVAVAQTLATNEDTDLSITLSGSDADTGDTLTYSVVTDPAHGTLSGSVPNLTYTPNHNYNGTESFTFKANDGTADSQPATITITVNPVNDAPTTIPQGTVTLNEDSSTSITLLATDVDGDTLTYSIDTNPAHGTVSVPDANGTLSYTPYADYAGTDSFTYHVNDGTLSSAITTINIDVTAVNDAPIAEAGADITAIEGSTVTLDGSGSSDKEGALSYSWRDQNNIEVSTSVTYSTSSLTQGTYTYTLQVTDSGGLTSSDSVTVTINAAAVVTFNKKSILGGLGTLEGTYVADVDGDGFIDILTADASNGINGWITNKRNGTFDTTLKSIDDTSSNTESVFSIDLDNDGDMDVISGMDSAKEWRWYKNDGSQVFGNPISIATSFTGTNYIGAYDVDHNGYTDVIVGSWDGSVAWYENDAGQTFAEHIVVSGRGHINTVCAADFDNDGDTDFVAALYGNGTIEWYENQYESTYNNVTFTRHNLANDGDIPHVYSVAVTDIDQDGFADIVSAPDGNGKLYWFRNNHDKTFTPHPLDNITTDFGSVDTADLDNDGDIDILYASYDHYEIGWYQNDGTGNVLTKKAIEVSALPLDPYCADLDNDGDLDFAVALPGNHEYAWYENTLLTGNEVRLLPKTGQKSSYAVADDGEYQKGVAHNFRRIGAIDIVIDESTGMMWQDDNDTQDKTLTWPEAMNYCENLQLGGFHDWRLPEIKPLYYLADKESATTLDTTYFQHTANTDYWSSDINRTTLFTLYVDFGAATIQKIKFFAASAKKNIRCVRGGKETFHLARDNTNDTVTDTRHRLVWDDSVDANITTADWQGALDHCENAGWRLPNIHELYSIVDPAKLSPAFESSFVYTANKKYWSSTTDNQGRRYVIDFDDTGLVENENNSTQVYNVRCVKDLP